MSSSIPLSQERQVTLFSASELARRIASGALSAKEVVDAHIRRIEEINPQINAVVQPLFKEAQSAAEAADAKATEARRSGTDLPPLHGVPVTVKDCFNVVGTDCTLGLAKRKGDPAQADSPLVARLREAGAVVLGKTNVHQGMLMHESNNPLFGRTNHPLDPKRSPGGSSGGEAAIVAAGGSPLGLASDLGGSIRQPAHSCGLCGLKPTTGRLTSDGSYTAMPGMQSIALQAGPLVRTVEDIDLAMRVLLDKSMVPRCQDESSDAWPDYKRVNIEGLRIGYMVDNGYFRPSPCIRQAVDSAAKVLANHGAQLEPWEAPDVLGLMELYLGLISADGMTTMRSLVSGESLEPQLATQLRLAKLPRPIRSFLGTILSATGEQYTVDLFKWSGPWTVKQYWDLTASVAAYRKNFMRFMTDKVTGKNWSGKKFDAFLFPASGLPALRHGTSMRSLPAASYCFLANLLDWPAGVVPFGTVQPGLESDRAKTNDRVVHTAQHVEAGSTGLPIGVQLMAAPWREDIALALMATLEEDQLQ